MHALWHWILYVLTSWSLDPQLLEVERARAAGCVTVAYASLATDPPPPPPAKEADPCRECKGTGRIYRPDGGWVRCKCNACPTGGCSKNLR